jgi:hypothetical protein
MVMVLAIQIIIKMQLALMEGLKNPSETSRKPIRGSCLGEPQN